MKDINLAKRIGLNLFQQYRKSQTKIHDLKYLFWECTLRCNLSCLHCGSNCSLTKSNDIPYKFVIDELKKIKEFSKTNLPHIVITGGEPLIRKDIEQFGYEIANLGYNWGMVTNGFFLTESRLVKLIKSRISSLTISLDGLENTHNWLRNNNDSFEKAINAIDLLSGKNELSFDVATCITKKNVGQLNDLKKLLITKKVKNWRLFTIDPIGRAKGNEDLLINSEILTKVLDFIKETKEEQKIDINYGCDGFLENYEGTVRDEFYFCKAGINIGSILHDGSISACPNLNRGFIQGNIKTDNFIDVWNNKYDKFRNREWTKTGICNRCESYKYCIGNGLCLRDIENNKVLRCHSKMITK